MCRQTGAERRRELTGPRFARAAENVVLRGRKLAPKAALVPDRTSDRRSPTRGLDHLTIECVTPELDCGRYPVKRIVGDVVRVGADVIKEGHDITAAHIVVRSPG